ncbi:MAG: hypothetical protein COB02_11590 [Candidatus Cloacimonadota bacterium]|nr:MAG: hypothetical protein COB02_11590 [Candidatus Cloacimonadota bacterium]
MKILSLFILFTLFNYSINATKLYRGKASNTFFGYSNVHNFTGKVNSTPFKVNLEGGLLDFSVSFPIIEMDTDNSKRNRQMQGMFAQKKFPKVITKFTKVSLKKLLSTKEFTQNFIINIRAKDFPATATFKNIIESKKKLEFDVECTLLLRKIGLRPPSMMFGMVKVKNRVDTKTHFEFKKSALAIIKEKLKKTIKK